MTTIHIICGKSGSGKDTVTKELLNRFNDKLIFDVGYTSRPMRDGEVDGVDYFFRPFKDVPTSDLVEWRAYQVCDGIYWHYWHTKIKNPEVNDILTITTPDTIEKYAKTYGVENIRVYEIVCSPEVLFLRMSSREMHKTSPNYAELCRRYLSDIDDWNKLSPKFVCGELGIPYHAISGNIPLSCEVDDISQLIFPPVTLVLPDGPYTCTLGHVSLSAEN